MKIKVTFYLCLVIVFISSINVFSQAPVITKQLSNQGVIEGQTATFSIEVTGDTLTYQWYKNDTLIVGANDSIYTTPATVVADNGSEFSVKVTNSSGSDSSNAATLYVTAVGSRVTSNEIAAYNFKEGNGSVIHDISGYKTPLDLNIQDSKTVIWTPKGLYLNSPSIINSSASGSSGKIVSAADSTNEITIEAWIVPDDTIQGSSSGGATVIALQKSNNFRTFSVSQKGSQYKARIRITDLNGLPEIITPSGVVDVQLTHLVFTRSADGTKKIFVNGVEKASGITTGDFGNWDDTHVLAIGSEYPSVNPWLGTYYYTALYNRALSSVEINHNYSLGMTSDSIPYFVSQPRQVYTIEGNTGTFNSKAVASVPISYQWQKNGVDIPGATDPSYTTPVLNNGYNGALYRIIASTTYGNDTSATAKLVVTPSDVRVAVGIQVLYDFQEGSGTTINDNSGVGSKLNENIGNIDSVEWKPYGLNLIGQAAIITNTAATKIINAATDSWELTIEAWIKPAPETKSGWIISNSQDENTRNFLLNQQVDSTYEVRLRTSITGLNGNPFIKTSSGVTKDSLTHVVYTRDEDGNVKIYINGEIKGSDFIGGGLTNWDTGYKLALGSEVNSLDNWKGVFNLVAIYSRALDSVEVVHNYSMGPVGNINLTDPNNLTAQATNPGKVQLSWKDNSNNEDGFIIERQLSGSAFEVIDTAGANDTIYTDSTVTDTTSYNYRVKAYNLLVESGYSNEVTIKTLLSTIPAPTELQAIKDISDTTNVRLLWTDNSSNELGFVIQRKLGDTASVALFAAIDTVGVDVVTYTDTTVSDTTTYTYRVYAFSSDTVSQFSNLAQITTPVPVELTSFTTNVVNGRIILSWETATEINNAGFRIERSNDNKVFSEIAFIKGNGTSTERISYSYTDKSALTGKYYYRLKQVDFDGSYNYSRSIEADMGLPTSYALYQNYPNPFNPSTIIRFALTMNARVNIKLYNTLGQEVTNILNSDLDAGVHETTFNASNLSSGVYFYRLEVHGIDGSNFTSTKRMLLMK